MNFPSKLANKPTVDTTRFALYLVNDRVVVSSVVGAAADIIECLVCLWSVA